MVLMLARIIPLIVCLLQYCSKSNQSRLEGAVKAFLSLSDLMLIAARSPSDIDLTPLTSSRWTAFVINKTSMC